LIAKLNNVDAIELLVNNDNITAACLYHNVGFEYVSKKEHWRKKATQPIQKTEQPTTPVLSEEVVEVKILKSQGVSDELITQLKKIAKVNETGLIEAQADPYFVAYKDKLEEELKKAKASLGASRGSGSVKKGKDFSTSGLSDEEHKQLWKDRMGL
jgi:hypothetical protein